MQQPLSHCPPPPVWLALLRKVGHLGSWPPTGPLSFSADLDTEKWDRGLKFPGGSLGPWESGRDWEKKPWTGRQEANLALMRSRFVT